MHINISNLYGPRARKSATQPIYARHFIVKTIRRRVALQLESLWKAKAQPWKLVLAEANGNKEVATTENLIESTYL